MKAHAGLYGFLADPTPKPGWHLQIITALYMFPTRDLIYWIADSGVRSKCKISQTLLQ